MALPLWFGPLKVLQEVELLTVEDNNNATRGWTRAHIKSSLIARRHDDHEPLPQEFDAAFRTVFSDLLRGDHLVKGVNRHYKLHTAVPHHLPSWFCKDAVLRNVGILDNNNNNDGGSTSAQIRNSLMETYHQQAQLLPPNFHRLLRKMLSVLRKRGHLTRGANGPQHYTRRQAPALNEPNPIPLEEFQLGECLFDGGWLLLAERPRLNVLRLLGGVGKSTALGALPTVVDEDELRRLCLRTHLRWPCSYTGCTVWPAVGQCARVLRVHVQGGTQQRRGACSLAVGLPVAGALLYGLTSNR
ncbi:hypothetical protein TRIUR3_15602 [Triticum urartu]|uniref:Uncharacterized protein n=1 Tax=Triticum urartu TaxID=4572 RepID=M8A1H8_TRIUA|nr:hypothetical protein TRIUR3_15602 [Triticum urartu]